MATVLRRVDPATRPAATATAAASTAVAALLALSVAGCGNVGATRSASTTAPPPSAPAPTTPALATTAPSPATTAPPTTAASTSAASTTAPPTTARAAAAPAATAAPAPFTASVATVTAADLPYTWRAGCPVAPAQLRMIHLSYWGFDGAAHQGAIVVNASVVAQVTSIFHTLYDARFPLAEVVPQDAYHGDDNAAAAADDTSGFNCRNAVTSGPPQWSVHAYGEAIDVNDVQNPYVDGSTVIPPSGAAYEDRAAVRPGMAVPGGTLVQAFASVGWQWGGRWSATPDYQHFSLTGG